MNLFILEHFKFFSKITHFYGDFMKVIISIFFNNLIEAIQFKSS